MAYYLNLFNNYTTGGRIFRVAGPIKYLCNLICLPSPAVSLCPLWWLDRHDLFVPQTRTTKAPSRAFAIIGPALWNQLISSTQSSLLTGEPSASFRCLKTALFSLGLSHWKRFWLVCTIHCKKLSQKKLKLHKYAYIYIIILSIRYCVNILVKHPRSGLPLTLHYITTVQ